MDQNQFVRNCLENRMETLLLTMLNDRDVYQIDRCTLATDIINATRTKSSQAGQSPATGDDPKYSELRCAGLKACAIDWRRSHLTDCAERYGNRG